jgi:hypothetical protein
MPTCVRQAWLVLGGNTIQLDNPSAGYMCQSLDLGTPIMRTVMNNRPDGDGIIDRTQYMGARTVVAAITALTGAGAQIDAVAASFAPYMVPSQRPVLHYVLDRPGAPERTLTLRPDAYDWPIAGAAQRDIALQWVAANPIAYAATGQSVTVPAGAGNAQGTLSPGDVPYRPLVAYTGPFTAPVLTFTTYLTAGPSSPGPVYLVAFLSSYTIAAGQTVMIDTAAHTVTLAGASILPQIDWTRTTWPVLPVSPGHTTISATGTGGVVGTTQAVVTWNDGFLV